MIRNQRGWDFFFHPHENVVIVRLAHRWRSGGACGAVAWFLMNDLFLGHVYSWDINHLANASMPQSSVRVQEMRMASVLPKSGTASAHYGWQLHEIDA